jgi:hypothetical protein
MDEKTHPIPPGLLASQMNKLAALMLRQVLRMEEKAVFGHDFLARVMSVRMKMESTSNRFETMPNT